MEKTKNKKDILEIKYIILPSELSFADVEYFLPFVSEERRELIRNFRVESGKMESLFAGLLARSEIAVVCNVEKEKLQFMKEENGKPYLAPSFTSGHPYHFSLSHSNGCIAFVGYDRPIGLDVEKISEDRERMNIARRFFDVKEYEYILNSEDSNKTFYEIWTRKEAYLKMTGEGLLGDLKSFCALDQEKYWSKSENGYQFSVCSESFSENSILQHKEDYSKQTAQNCRSNYSGQIRLKKLDYDQILNRFGSVRCF